MSVNLQAVIGNEWKERLGLSTRGKPELYESANEVTESPHAGAIRTAFDDLGVSAVFCVQGVPTIMIISVQEYDRDAIVGVHGALWNQGLASLLLVITDDTLRAFSLSRVPLKERNEEFERRCLVTTLDAVADALSLKDIVYGAESGRIWQANANFFKPKERIDQVLLDNLIESHALLCDAELSSDAAQALLIQAMFIAYLEDRGITNSEYFRSATEQSVGSFWDLLTSKKPRLLGLLFDGLREDFNGDLFVAPCSFESATSRPDLTETHLNILARFHSGREEMGSGGGQYRFWGYDFRYIPVELISAVYDRFLGEKEEERRAQGAYYTPMYLADTVVSQVWSLLTTKAKDSGRFLDPACGSGVFLVRSFQRLCEQWRANHRSNTIPWNSLRKILSRLNGWDLNGGAVRVAVFSLYIALLEEVSPPDIRRLLNQGKMLPQIWNKNLIACDFFEATRDAEQFDIIIGNPPWTSRRGPDRSSVRWSESHNTPMPAKEDAWAFTWKALRHISKNGIISFLLPAMGFLHKSAENTVRARSRLFRDGRIWRVINFADLRFQLFEGATRPAALFIFGKNQAIDIPYEFDYWAPKADLNLRLKRFITLSNADKMTLDSKCAIADALTFKRRLWMREPDAKLFRETLIYSVSGYNTDHHSKLHGDFGNASTNAHR